MSDSGMTDTAGVIWLTGLSGSGKSTISVLVCAKLKSLGLRFEALDGDAIREVFPSTGFSKEERDQHIKRVGFLASRLEHHGVTVVASLISPYEESRNFVRGLCQNFFEVFIDAPLSLCESRDPKGLYKKARSGQIKQFTGIDSPYEIPKSPNLRVDTDALSPEQATEQIVTAFSEFLRERKKP